MDNYVGNVEKGKQHSAISYIIYQSSNINLFSMQTLNNWMHPKRRYSYISLKKRESLVQEVLLEHKSLSKTAKRLNIRLSTAKLILKKYKLHGKFFMKKTHHHRTPAPQDPLQPLENQPRPKQPQIEEDVNTIAANNMEGQAVTNMAGEVSVCCFLIYYPVDSAYYEWYGWNIMPVAYLQ